MLKDKILANILAKYISKTPFLVYIEKNILELENDKIDCDVIFAEVTHETINYIESLIKKLKDRKFIIFSDIKSLINFEKHNQIIILQKNITYSDFLNALTLISDERKLENSSNKY